jgi:hypothetical protein
MNRTEILPVRLVGRRETLTLIVERFDRQGLSQHTARNIADEKLKQEEALGGWGGPWYFIETVRQTRCRVEVSYEA